MAYATKHRSKYLDTLLTNLNKVSAFRSKSITTFIPNPTIYRVHRPLHEWSTIESARCFDACRNSVRCSSKQFWTLCYISVLRTPGFTHVEADYLLCVNTDASGRSNVITIFDECKKRTHQCCRCKNNFNCVLYVRTHSVEYAIQLIIVRYLHTGT